MPRTGRPSSDPVERFWPKVQKGDGCWEWQASRNRQEYGQFHWRQPDGRMRSRGAHRFSWELHHGPIPADMLVLHHCDNPPCVRPDHLFLGTCQDNKDDQVLKNRQPKGEEVAHLVRLTAVQVMAMRVAHLSGVPTSVLAKWFGVNWTTADLAIRGETWKHLPPLADLNVGPTRSTSEWWESLDD